MTEAGDGNAAVQIPGRILRCQPGLKTTPNRAVISIR